MACQVLFRGFAFLAHGRYPIALEKVSQLAYCDCRVPPRRLLIRSETEEADQSCAADLFTKPTEIHNRSADVTHLRPLI